MFDVSDLSESILQSMKRSRRLLFVLSPDFLAEKSFSLLECRLGLYLQHGHQASIVAVVRRSVSKLPFVEVVQLRQASICTVTWRGIQSEPRRSRFWLRLRLALPVRPLALGRRLIDSTSSHSDLAALALHRAQRIRNQDRTSRRTSANHRGRKTPPKGSGSVRREEGQQHGRRCSGCAGFVGQMEDRRVELRVQTEIQQVLCNDTDAVSETSSNINPDPAHKHGNPASSSDPAPSKVHQESNGGTSINEKEVDPTRTSEEHLQVEKREGLMVEISQAPPPTKNPA